MNALRMDSYKNVYETLMDYCIRHDVLTNVDQAKRLVRLQIKHHQLNELLKVI